MNTYISAAMLKVGHTVFTEDGEEKVITGIVPGMPTHSLEIQWHGGFSAVSKTSRVEIKGYPEQTPRTPDGEHIAWQKMEKRAQRVERDPATILFGFFASKDEPNLPPIPMQCVPEYEEELASFVESFIRLQENVDYVSYRGSSICRRCGSLNGSRTHTITLDNGKSYAWPSGYLHYLKDHKCVPCEEAIELVSEFLKQEAEKAEKAVVKDRP